jgi:hypothetical protein
MDSAHTNIQRLLDIEAIKRLKARYCRYIDTKQWTKLSELFAADARFEGFLSAPQGADVSTFVKGVSERLQSCISIHHCHTPEIAFPQASVARGAWAMMDYLEWPMGSMPFEIPGQRGFVGFGHYEEEYRKVDGRWVFSFVRLTRLRVDPLHADHPVPMKGLLSASADWLDASR